MHIDRLEHLENLLRANAVNPVGMRFNLDGWIGDSTLGFGAIMEHPDNWVPTVSCSTVGCAIGLASMDPKFNEWGLPIMNNRARRPQIMNPVSGEVFFDEWQGIALLFDIATHQAEYLFYAGNYDGFPTVGAEGELAVADRIHDMIEHYKQGLLTDGA